LQIEHDHKGKEKKKLTNENKPKLNSKTALFARSMAISLCHQSVDYVDRVRMVAFFNTRLRCFLTRSVFPDGGKYFEPAVAVA
jgi:hypothetical protein